MKHNIGLGLIVLVLIVMIVFGANVLAPIFNHVDEVQGKIINLWTVDGGIRGASMYAGVQLADGNRRGVEIPENLYGILEVGQFCTFQVRSSGYARTVNCDSQTR